MTFADQSLNALVARRRARALELRVTGMSLLDIGRFLAADPALNTAGTSYPQGYGQDLYDNDKPPPSDNSLYGMVGNDIARALKDNREACAVQAEEYRQLDALAIDAAFRRVYSKVVDFSDLSQIPNMLRLMERRSKLFGYDTPVRTEVTLTDGELDSQLAAVLAELADLGQVPDAEGSEGETPAGEGDITG